MIYDLQYNLLNALVQATAGPLRLVLSSILHKFNWSTGNIGVLVLEALPKIAGSFELDQQFITLISYEAFPQPLTKFNTHYLNYLPYFPALKVAFTT